MKEDGIDGSGTTIKIVISSGSHFREVAVNPRSTFGELKIVLAELFGLAPGEQRLLFRGKEKEDADFLHTAGVRDQSRVVLMASPVVQQEEISETTYHQVDSVVCEAVVGVRVEVDKLAEKVSRLALAIEGGNKVSEQEFLVLPELLMRQLLKLDCIEAEGEAKVQRRNEVRRVQSLVDTLDTLKERNGRPFGNSSSKVVSGATQWEIFDSDSGGRAPTPAATTPASTTQDWVQFD